MSLPRKSAAQRFLGLKTELQQLELFCKGTVLHWALPPANPYHSVRARPSGTGLLTCLFSLIARCSRKPVRNASNYKLHADDPYAVGGSAGGLCAQGFSGGAAGSVCCFTPRHPSASVASKPSTSASGSSACWKFASRSLRSM